MFTTVHHRKFREGLLVEAPSLAISLGIAEVFYKFHSFSLECIAFLATWFLFGGVLAWLVRRGFQSREA